MSSAVEPVLDINFSVDRLIRLLQLGNPHTVWRHDVDYDLDCAVKMARLEYVYGVHSTFFLRATADEYRPGTEQFDSAVRQILQCGHQIGAHVDLRLPRDASVSLMYLRQCCSRQISELGLDVRQVSFHAPPVSALWRHIPGYDYVMGPEWQGRVLTDSRGVLWQKPEEILRLRWQRFQLSLHPEWWFLPVDEAAAMREREMANP